IALIALPLQAFPNYYEKRNDCNKFKDVVVFGNGFSDTGNAYKLTKNKYPPSPPYFHGRFSNGPIWPDYFVSIIKAKLHSYAFGGASCDSTLVPSFAGPNKIPVPGLVQQVDNFISKDIKKFNLKETLFVFATIFLDYQQTLGQADPAKIVASVGQRLESLYKAGANNIMFFTSMPTDMYTPGDLANISPDVLKLMSEKGALHNQYTDDALAAFKKDHPNVNLFLVKFDEVISTAFSPETLQKLGITVFDIACIPDNGFAGKRSVVCNDPKKYLHFDNETALNTKVIEEAAKKIVTYLTV
ncbi:6700_t:CDS:2, partial [Cetraspora pellucida]